jgi:hypothetical protein
VEQLFLALLFGYKLIVTWNNALMEPDKLMEYIKITNVTHIHMTPSYLKQLDFSNV